MAKEPTVRELQEMYGGMMIYDKVERCSTYIPKRGELTETQIRALREEYLRSSQDSPSESNDT